VADEWASTSDHAAAAPSSGPGDWASTGDHVPPPTVARLLAGQENQPHLGGSGWDAFKENLQTATSGTIGDYLGALAHVVGAPVEGLLHAPIQILDWARRGGHNPPSGGFLSEEPVTEAEGDALAALTPGSGEQVVRGVKSAGKGTAAGLGEFNLLHPLSLKPLATAGRAILDYWKNNPPEQVPGPGMAYPDLSLRPRTNVPVSPSAPPEFESIPQTETPSGRKPGTGEPKAAPAPPATRVPLWQRIQAASTPQSPPEFSSIPQTQLPSGRIPGVAQPGLNIDVSAAPKPSTPELLNGLARSLAGKDYAKLAADDQQAVQNIASRISNPPAAAPSSAPAAAAPAPAPANGTTPIAQQLFEEAQKSGTVPAGVKPGQQFGGTPPADVEGIKANARTQRASSANTFAGTFHQFGIASSDLPNITMAQWDQIAKAQGLEFPTTKAAQAKLIRDTTNQLRALESNGK
jgi:hypothetical protein